MLRRAFVALAALPFAAAAAPAQSLGDADRSEFRRIIAGQISAFNADDGPSAYGFAAPLIQRMFPTPEIFMSMVRNGYKPVYRQQSYKFGDASIEGAGVPVQRVVIVDVAGRLWTAVYTFERQSDGSWRISGCSLVQMPAESA